MGRENVNIRNKRARVVCVFSVIFKGPLSGLSQFLVTGSPLNSAANYMFKVNNRNTRARCEIWSKLTIKTPERHNWCRSGVFIAKGYLGYKTVTSQNVPPVAQIKNFFIP